MSSVGRDTHHIGAVELGLSGPECQDGMLFGVLAKSGDLSRLERVYLSQVDGYYVTKKGEEKIARFTRWR